jgi:hypothetical protein
VGVGVSNFRFGDQRDTTGKYWLLIAGTDFVCQPSLHRNTYW